MTTAVFTNHLDQAIRSFPLGPPRVNARAQAVSLWNTFSGDDQAYLRRQIEIMTEGKRLQEEAMTYLLRSQNNEPDFGWIDKWSPILAKAPRDMTNDEVVQLNAFRRILASYMFSNGTYRTALTSLLTSYTQSNMRFAFDTWINTEQATSGAIYTGLIDVHAAVNRVCNDPLFDNRLGQATQDKTKTWVQAVTIFSRPDRPDKLWLCLAFDDEGRVVDRMVKKVEALPEPKWSMPKYWQNGQVGGTPNEFYLQNRCWAQDNTAFVQHRLLPDVDPVGCSIVYWIHYCPHGTLRDLYTPYQRANLPIPEPILWMVFQKLVEQCMIMQKGSKIPGTSVPNWNWIVHRDIKPDNVFLDDPDSNGWFPRYLTPKMADFGFAFETWPTDPNNPGPSGLWTGWGTRHYRAPEQREDPKFKGPKGRPPNEANLSYRLQPKTNIWGIGTVMLTLAQGGVTATQKSNNIVQDAAGNWGVQGNSTDNFANAYYSPSLLQLINSAIMPYPQDRPTAEELLTTISTEMCHATGAPGAPIAPGLYCLTAACGSQDEGGPFAWQRAQEQYKLWSATDPALRLP